MRELHLPPAASQLPFAEIPNDFTSYWSEIDNLLVDAECFAESVLALAPSSLSTQTDIVSPGVLQMAERLSDLVDNVRRRQTAIRSGSVISPLASLAFTAAYAQAMTLLNELRWLIDYGDAASKGFDRRQHEQDAQRKGAKANSRRAEREIINAASWIMKNFTPDEIQCSTDSFLAKQIAASGVSRSKSTLRNYVRKMRQRESIPPRRR